MSSKRSTRPAACIPTARDGAAMQQQSGRCSKARMSRPTVALVQKYCSMSRRSTKPRGNIVRGCTRAAPECVAIPLEILRQTTRTRARWLYMPCMVTLYAPLVCTTYHLEQSGALSNGHTLGSFSDTGWKQASSMQHASSEWRHLQWQRTCYS